MNNNVTLDPSLDAKKTVFMIQAIALRGSILAQKLKYTEFPVARIEECITKCHMESTPLDLVGLLEEANPVDFAHDVFGICRHLETSTGRLRGLFEPRFSVENRRFTK